MKLYYAPGACSLASHIVAREAGIDIELERVDIRTRTTETGRDYLEVTPKGYVAALQLDNGQVLTESAAILQYLADQKPDSRLLPAFGTLDRYHVLEMLTYISTELHQSHTPMFRPDTSPEVRQERMAYVRMRYRLIEQCLVQKPLLFGDQFTVADAYLFTIIGWAPGVGLHLSDFPALGAFQQRVAARPSVQAALQTEGLLPLAA